MEKGDFVRVFYDEHEEYENFGVGKFESVQDDVATVSYFDGPVSELVRVHVPAECVCPTRLSRHARVYWHDVKLNVWRVGRITNHDGSEVEVRFPNQNDRFISSQDVYIRWDCPLEDPSGYLAHHINETPIFSDGRSAFVKALTRQRKASMGMPALISSVIDLEAHQIEVVRRVLQDPIQRYLLADEVGLGKTIEAGILIRQYVLDDPINHKILIIVPPTLVHQWQDELIRRFLLEVEVGDSVHVVSAVDRMAVTGHVAGAGMVVVDEAHHIRRGEWLYDLLSKETTDTPRLLLLSATPALGNETGFHEMLHLLDPLVFSFDNTDAFRRKIINRQSLAEAVAGLIPENLLQLDHYLVSLSQLFSDDDRLIELVEDLQEIVDEFPEDDDPQFLEALFSLRSHLAETYRLDRRILRNRRKGVPGLTPERGGVAYKDYTSSAMMILTEVLDEWRSHIALRLDEGSEEAKKVSEQFVQIIDALVSHRNSNYIISECINPLLKDASETECRLINDIIKATKLLKEETDLADVISNIIEEGNTKTKFIVFCSDDQVADDLCDELSILLDIPVDRNSVPLEGEEDLVISNFQSDPLHRVLICDQSAEEGLNLQGGDKVIIHYDLPFSPNRIEQRLGRVDRYGSGERIQSIALRCSSNPYEKTWHDCLTLGLAVFGRSIASLQYLVNAEMEKLEDLLLFDGVEAISNMAEMLGGADGEISRELKRIDQQDALDSLIIPDEETFEDLFEEDGQWLSFKSSVDGWLVDVLLMRKTNGPNVGPLPDGDQIFRYMLSRQGGQETLISLDKFLENFLSVLDLDAPNSTSNRPLSYLYTSRRPTALKLRAREENVRLLRYGDTLLKGLMDLTALDDRGRSVALWRKRSSYVTPEQADVFMQFQFITEAETDSAAARFSQLMGGSLETSQAAMRRRGDMMFPPTFHRVWLNSDLEPVVDPASLALLNEPYLKIKNSSGDQDRNMNWDMWGMVKELDLPTVDFWAEFVSQARGEAETVLRNTTNLENRIEEAVKSATRLDQGRFAQLQTRIKHADGETEEFEKKMLEIETTISEIFYAGIRSPKITLDTIGAVFLSRYSLENIIKRRQLSA